MTAADIAAIAADLEPGTAVGMLLFEHVWAAKFKYAMRSTGGVPIAQGFLTPEALFMVGKEVQAIVEAEAVIEIADAVKGAAMLDALATRQRGRGDQGRGRGGGAAGAHRGGLHRRFRGRSCHRRAGRRRADLRTGAGRG
ncbi:MAG: hypothetical protein R2851_04280 [Caldilineaceae bacterium]